jgi:hypothetical protein
VEGSQGGTVEVKDRTVSAAAARDIVVRENGRTETLDCAGGTASVDGNSSVLTLRGCRDLTVNGNGNKIEVAGAATISLYGNANDLGWTPGPGGDAPKVSDLGKKNVVTPSSRPARANARRQDPSAPHDDDRGGAQDILPEPRSAPAGRRHHLICWIWWRTAPGGDWQDRSSAASGRRRQRRGRRVRTIGRERHQRGEREGRDGQVGEGTLQWLASLGWISSAPTTAHGMMGAPVRSASRTKPPRPNRASL